MILKLLPKVFPKMVRFSYEAFALIQLWDYVTIRRRLKIKDLAISQPEYEHIYPYPRVKSSICYLVPATEWNTDEVDGNQLLLRILEHETVHDILYREQMLFENGRFDSIFNIEPGHPLTMSDLQTGVRY